MLKVILLVVPVVVGLLGLATWSLVSAGGGGLSLTELCICDVLDGQ